MNGPGERLFEAFVQALVGNGVRHVFLRGYGSYPSVPSGSDVDMLVHPHDRAAAEAAFRASARAQGFHLWQRFRSGFLTRLYAYAHDPEAGHVFFDLDLHNAEASYGIPYLSAEDLLEHARLDGALARLPEPLEAMVNGLGQLFMAGSIAEKYRSPWAAHAGDETAQRLLAACLGSAAAQAILGSLSASAESKRVDGRRLGASTRRCMLWRYPLRSISGFLSFAFGERVRPWFLPRGLFLVFAGTDGSGKTTMIKELLRAIAPRFRDGSVEEHHLRPMVIPQISALFHGGQPAYGLEDMVDPHRSVPSGFVGSSLRTLYYWFDYFIGYPLCILPKRRRNSLIIYDRWFYDHMVDPRRFRIAPGHPLPGFLQRFLTKPDRIIVCTAPAEVILSRKQELSSEEVARQVSAYGEFARRMERTTLLDTSRDIESCVDELILSIFGARR